MSLQLGLTIAPRMKQELKLTPQLQLSIRHLQLSRMDLIEEIQQELMSNPLLEDQRVGEESEARSKSTQDTSNNAESPSPAEDTARPDLTDLDSASQSAEARQEMDWDQYLEESRPRAELDQIRISQEEHFSPESTYTRGSSLNEHLLEQVQLSDFSVSERLIAEELIWNLDERGYLVGVTAQDIAQMLDVDVELVEEVIESLLHFDPVGVCARDLRECLLAQCRAQNAHSYVATLIDHHLEDVAHNRLPYIAKQLKLSLEEVGELLVELRGFEPYPGRRFNSGATAYVTPDVYVEWVEGELSVRANDEGFPRLKINGYYRDQLRAHIQSSDEQAKLRARGQRTRASGGKSEGKRYVTERLSSAQAFINSLQQRKQTIVQVMECIIDLQRDFFLHGPEYLKPLVLRQIAEILDLHESTISRATSHKFVHTPRGLYELKYFFHSKIQSSDGSDDLASQAVKIKIQNLIAEEDPRKPLSDQKLTQLLANDGVSIARRTVAKYRESLGILSSSKRRKHV